GMILDITNTATSGTMILRNDTVENTGGTSLGGGDALLVGANTGDSNSVTLSNSIARGTANDIRGSGGGTTTLTADHSNYGSVFGSGGSISITPPGSGTNQTNSPQFVNAAAGDFHELASSPTV